jgi:peptidoglycan/LPS O-acetylase OafA/YrhL
MWMHIPQSEELKLTTAFARFRLTTFVILSTFFLLSSQKAHPGRKLGEYAWIRFRTLYLPFLAWASMYFAGKIVLHACVRGTPWPHLGFDSLLDGQTPHLWFLPYILLAGIATFPLGHWLQRHREHFAQIIAGALLVGLATATISEPVFNKIAAGLQIHDGTRDFVYRAFTLTPCVFLGIAVYYVRQLTRHHAGKTQTRIALLGLSVIAGCIVYNCLWPSNPVLEAVAGLGMVLSAFWPTHNKFVTWVGTLGRFSYGMYLVHMMFVTAIVVFRANVIRMAPVWWYDVLTLLLCVPLSLCASILLSRSRYTRWLIAAPEPVTKPLAPSLTPVASQKQYLNALSPL